MSISTALELVVLAEQERECCARIAEKMAKQFVNGEATTIYGAGYQKACEHIAAAIRDGAAR